MKKEANGEKRDDGRRRVRTTFRSFRFTASPCLESSTVSDGKTPSSRSIAFDCYNRFGCGGWGGACEAKLTSRLQKYYKSSVASWVFTYESIRQAQHFSCGREEETGRAAIVAWLHSPPSPPPFVLRDFASAPLEPDSVLERALALPPW